MNRYDSIDCPICNAPLDNGEDVVVCPECGAPFHRHCYLETGHCTFTELHDKGESWQPPKIEETVDGDAPLRCSRCATINPPHGLFCQVCGNQLNDKSTADSDQSHAGTPPPFGMGGFSPAAMPLNPFTTPFGGVAPDEVIDGIPAKDLAVFVGKNTHYFLPRFKDIAQKRTKTINWSAFLFQGGYFLYRKMYGFGILAIIISAILEIPSTLILFDSLSATAGTASPIMFDTDTMTAISMICSFLSFGFRMLCGILSNTLYKKHTFKIINKCKQMNLGEEQYLSTITKKGSVATKLISGLLIAYMLISVIGMYMMILMGV